ncbi:HTH domain-containing protein (plasmid) [Roseibium aggregatum]|uniref:helix-turn-helix transcriptional regulator n=1 Tax=Roseibium aggregatum TaxID=187304 RepID=UPI001E52797E|nr:YafY family protein [Roseibium aggregatum]UES60065.1 HTH domain-containing protein [Roseibium aggregatum]
MQRTDRLFEIIQLLRRQSQPVASTNLAKQLEVSQRTIYRDIVTLQSMRVPIEGEVGVGYIMTEDYDLPPLNFDREEIEAIIVGLSLLSRTGDKALERAAKRVLSKVDTAKLPADTLSVSDWGIEGINPIIIGILRTAVAEERKVEIKYTDLSGAATRRLVLPLAITYYVRVAVLATWCELRSDFRHFRIDRITDCDLLQDTYAGTGIELRARLQKLSDRHS